MKFRYLLPMIVLLFGGNLVGQVLDDRFHSYTEIQVLLDTLSSNPDYSSIFRVDTIGYSQHDHLPILAVKISDNVQQKEDEPRVLFLGQCHAEEILGVEAVIKFIDLMLNPAPAMAMHIHTLRTNIETWIIPTHNPEGMEVVFSELDVSYRKNKHDFSPDGPWPNGIFDYDPSIGNDFDGVDLNRNYDFNWMFGENFGELDPTPYGAHYDYFKGLAPFSEPETRAIRDLALEHDFMFSIAWHSSRSGNLSEKVFYPWDWDGKTTPDNQEIIAIGETMANLLINESGQGNYLPVYGGSRNGKAHDWFYAATGCFQYLIECGTANLQPDSALIEDTVDRLLPAMLYLMDRLIGYGTDATQIAGFITSESSPLADARVEILELSGSVQDPRLTDEFGRFRRIVHPGTYTLVTSKPGFFPDTTIVTSNISSLTNVNIDLHRRPIHNVGFTIAGSSMPVTVVFSSGEVVDTVNMSAGTNYIDLFEDQWQAVFSADDSSPVLETCEIAGGATYLVNFYPSLHSWHPDLSDSTEWMDRHGQWCFVVDTLKSQSDWLYPNSITGRDTNYLISPPLNVSGSNRLTVRIKHRFETEWDQDTIAVRLIDNSGTILANWQLAEHGWDKTRTDWIGSNSLSGFDTIRVMLRMLVDGTVNYRGWQVFDLKLTAVNDPLLMTDAEPEHNRSTVAISNPYPNPSNGMIGIDLSMISGPVVITVFDLQGRQVYTEKISHNHPQALNWRYNFHNTDRPASSGVYFLRVKTPLQTTVKKCIILKN